jgi:hypothetical protein
MQTSAELPPHDTFPDLSFAAIASQHDAIAVSNAKQTEPLGSKARRAFHDLKLFRAARHPPVKAAFYPGVREATVLAAIAYLLPTAGRTVKQATGRALWRQGADMLTLWFQQRIDPPSYYAQDMYKPDHYKEAEQYLTRYETKNGLMATLNTLRPRPFNGHEMNDKVLFAALCEASGIQHPRTLAKVENGVVDWLSARDSIAFDLFCKRRKGMGARGTLAYRHLGNGKFADERDQVLDLSDIEIQLRSKKQPMLVQRRLRNHPELADLAKDSLLAVRVITCLNEQDEPEVCLAMMRILTVLEPDWQHLPDGEYAAPINLVTGELGVLAGDNMKTSPFRSDVHPANGAQIAGRLMPQWDAITKLACLTHKAVPHRLMLGWDIAITPEGPVMLEGNTNFDVMFLQRVHNAPASQSRFGELLGFHLEAFKMTKESR